MKVDKLSTQINTNSDTLTEVLRKTKDLEESLTATQDLVYSKVTKLEENIKKLKLFADEKDSEIK